MIPADLHSTAGYDEINEYDREMERPENVNFEDPSWDFKTPFVALEAESMRTALRESDLIQQIGE